MNVMALIPKIHLQDICFSVLFLIFWECAGGGGWGDRRKSIFPARSVFFQLEKMFHLLSDGIETFFPVCPY